MMLRKLRWQLSLLYVLAAAVLIALIGGGAYGLLTYYFEASTDLALQYKVALEYTKNGQPVPPDLQTADQAWQTSRKLPTTTPFPVENEDDGGDDNKESEKTSEQPIGSLPESGGEHEEYYDSELASIFLLPINTQGQLISNPNAYTLSFPLDSQAITAALANGSDFRTVRQDDGSRVRLFTFRVSDEDDLAVLQVGRSLKDQDRLLSQLLAGLAVLGGLSVLIVGIGSWWLAGRSLIPAQQAWDRQQTFVANASHELRAPLTLLRASAEVACRGLDTQDPRHELLGDILNEVDHMNRLVEDLLLLSRLDAGRLKMDQQPVEASVLLNDLTREVSRLAAERGVTLEVIQAQGSVLADPIRLRQVLLIILDNALRHTSAGGAIRLEARSDSRRAQWQVRDTGSGIPARHLAHIFERFYRGEEDRSQANPGSGLGLAIAKGLVEAMHGQITLTSQPGHGTHVTINLPAAPSESVEEGSRLSAQDAA
jgi:signal transduction histidine kinase